MQKLIGGALILAACIGGALGERQRRRAAIALAEELTGSLSVLSRELGRSAPDTETLLCRAEAACTGGGAAFYRELRRKMAEEPEESLFLLWKQTVKQFCLPNRIAEEFASAGRLLGRYTAEEQRAGLQMTVQALQEELQLAKEEERRASRLGLALGSCAAVFLLVLLL